MKLLKYLLVIVLVVSLLSVAEAGKDRRKKNKKDERKEDAAEDDQQEQGGSMSEKSGKKEEDERRTSGLAARQEEKKKGESESSEEDDEEDEKDQKPKNGTEISVPKRMKRSSIQNHTQNDDSARKENEKFMELARYYPQSENPTPKRKNDEATEQFLDMVDRMEEKERLKEQKYNSEKPRTRGRRSGETAMKKTNEINDGVQIPLPATPKATAKP